MYVPCPLHPRPLPRPAEPRWCCLDPRRTRGAMASAHPVVDFMRKRLTLMRSVHTHARSRTRATRMKPDLALGVHVRACAQKNRDGAIVSAGRSEVQRGNRILRRITCHAVVGIHDRIVDGARNNRLRCTDSIAIQHARAHTETRMQACARTATYIALGVHGGSRAQQNRDCAFVATICSIVQRGARVLWQNTSHDKSVIATHHHMSHTNNVRYNHARAHTRKKHASKTLSSRRAKPCLRHCS